MEGEWRGSRIGCGERKVGGVLRAAFVRCKRASPPRYMAPLYLRLPAILLRRRAHCSSNSLTVTVLKLKVRCWWRRRSRRSLARGWKRAPCCVGLWAVAPSGSSISTSESTSFTVGLLLAKSESILRLCRHVCWALAGVCPSSYPTTAVPAVFRERRSQADAQQPCQLLASRAA